MTDIIAKKSQFDIIVTRADDRLIATDPITVKNQIQEIHSIDDLGLNTASRADGSLVTWNANTNAYDVKPFNTYVTFSWGNTHTFNSNVIFKSVIFANNSSGLAGQVLTSNGQGVYWSNVASSYAFGLGLTANSTVVSVNAAYISALILVSTANNAAYLNGKTEANLNVNSAVYSTNSQFAITSNNATYAFGKLEGDINANSATYLGGFTSSYFAANSSLSNYYLATNPNGYITTSGTANNATYAFGKTEANLNVNSAITANSSTYFGGQLADYYAANSSLANYYLATNPAGYINASASITGSSNNATYLGGKLEANLNVNSAVYSTNSSFAFTANNTVNLNGQPASYYSNASNINTGTLPNAQLPAPRVVPITDGTSITVNTDITDIATQINTQVAGTLTVNAPTGTPRDGQKFILKIKSTNSQTFSWDVIFGGSFDIALPSSTTGYSLTDYMGFQYDVISSQWHMIAKNFGF